MLTVPRFGIYPFRVVRGPEMLSRRGTSSIEGISLPTCISLVTATMVGTGVYTTLGFQLQDLHSGFTGIPIRHFSKTPRFLKPIDYNEEMRG